MSRPFKDEKLAISIGYKLKELREKYYPEHGRMPEMCKAVGVTPQTWNKWEAGISVPSDVNQRRIAKLFNISVAELRGENIQSTTQAINPGKFPGSKSDVKFVESLRSAALIRQYLDTVQEYMFQGLLSADDFLALANSLISALQVATIDLERKRVGSSGKTDHA